MRNYSLAVLVDTIWTCDIRPVCYPATSGLVKAIISLELKSSSPRRFAASQLRGAVICVAVGSLIANGDDVHSRACGMHFYRRESGDTVVKGVDPNMLNMAVVPARCW